MNPFGECAVPVRHSRPRGGTADVAHTRARLASLADHGNGGLEIMCPPPTAAFSSRDALLPGYGSACAVVAEQGFAPMIRPVGGHLAVYDRAALVVHLVARHPAPRTQIRQRFEIFGEVLAGVLRGYGVDARVGAIPGEYCDGAYSINAAGRRKIVGVGQRITRFGYLLSAVISVRESADVCRALERGYAELALDFDPATVGSLAEVAPDVAAGEVEDRVVAALGTVIGLFPDSAELLTPAAMVV